MPAVAYDHSWASSACAWPRSAVLYLFKTRAAVLCARTWGHMWHLLEEVGVFVQTPNQQHSVPTHSCTRTPSSVSRWSHTEPLTKRLLTPLPQSNTRFFNEMCVQERVPSCPETLSGVWM